MDYEDRYVQWILHVAQPWMQKYCGVENNARNMGEIESSLGVKIRQDCGEFLERFQITIRPSSYRYEFYINLTADLKDGREYRAVAFQVDETSIHTLYADEGRIDDDMKYVDGGGTPSFDPIAAYERAMGIVGPRK